MNWSDEEIRRQYEAQREQDEYLANLNKQVDAMRRAQTHMTSVDKMGYNRMGGGANEHGIEKGAFTMLRDKDGNLPVDEDGNPIYIKTGETKTVKDGEYSESTITCYPEDGGASFPVTGVNPSCPVGSSETAPAATLKKTCYVSNGDGTYSTSPSDITGVCPTGYFDSKAAADFADTTIIDDDDDEEFDEGEALVLLLHGIGSFRPEMGKLSHCLVTAP